MPHAEHLVDLARVAARDRARHAVDAVIIRMHQPCGVTEGEHAAFARHAEHFVHRARPEQPTVGKIEIPEAATAARERRLDPQVRFGKDQIGVAGTLGLDVIGVEHHQQDRRDTCKQGDVQRNLVSPGRFELGDRRCGQHDASRIGQLRQRHDVVGACDRRLHDARMFAEILQRRDVGRGRSERAADERSTAFRACKDPPVLAHREDERSGIEHTGRQKLAEALLRLGTTALIEQRDSVRLEGGDGDRRRKTDGLARTFLHAGVLVHDAGHARNRNDDQECNDQDRDGALENRLRVCQAA